MRKWILVLLLLPGCTTMRLSTGADFELQNKDVVRCEKGEQWECGINLSSCEDGVQYFCQKNVKQLPEEIECLTKR